MTTNLAPRALTASEEGISDDDAREHVRRVATASGSSFLLPMRFLAKPRREGMFAVYAFCREVDDISDGAAPTAEKRAQLAAWRREIDRLFDGEASLPTARALAGPARRFGLRKADFLALIDGMEMDATETIAAPSFADLELYCDRVASTVGRLSVRVFGATGSAADEVAQELGQALQLTNILRDLKEDAERGRLYLPRELLEAHDIRGHDPDTVLAHPALPAVCADVATIAKRRFAAADRALARCERRPMRPAIAMKEIYRRILDRLERRGWERLDEPVRVPALAKLWIAARCLLA